MRTTLLKLLLAGAPAAALLLGAGCNGEPWFVDEDGDGFGTEEGKGKRPAAGAASVGGDCDDADDEVHPDADELCDGVDTNCDGDLPAEEGVDGDDDGAVACAPDRDWAGDPSLTGGDCDDADDAVHPGADEGCDGVDTDCDGAPAATEVDGDGDGFVSCEPGSDWQGPQGLEGGDCDDAVGTAHPGASEVCDGVDSDCDGNTPGNEIDDDGDLHVECSDWVGDGSMGGGDCDDTNPLRSAGLPEQCNGVDDDCDAVAGAEELDGDGDGYVACEITGDWFGDPAILGGGDCGDEYTAVHPDRDEFNDGYDTNCDGTLNPEEVDDDGDGYVEIRVIEPFWIGPDGMLGQDCDDTNPDIHPDLAELCDGIDNDCDLQPDASELDQDGDGLIGCAYDAATWSGPAGVSGGGDCNDRDAGVHPGVTEVCDWQDNDCNGQTDDDDPGLDPATLRTFYLDDDVDGWGLEASTTTACHMPAGYAPALGDCDDTERSVHPFAREQCDGGVDNDCNSLADDADPDLDPDLAVLWFPDQDRDGVGDGTGQALIQCDAPDAAWSDDPKDCDDADATVHFGAAEVCNGVDDDCDGHPDLPGAGGATSELGCDLCTTAADYNPLEIHTEVLDPCVLDPAANDLCGDRWHKVRWRTDVSPSSLRPELFLFLPPSAGTFNNDLMTLASHAGYRTILFGQSNEAHVNEICPTDPDPNCSVNFTWEAFYGVDLSPHIAIDPPDSMNTRLEVLLQYMAATYPGEGWDQYVDPADGSVMWDRIIVSGWSKATTYAIFAAQQFPVNGLFLLSNPNDPLTITLQTPVCRRFALYHEDEYTQFHYPDQASYEAGFRSLGMGGATLDMDTAPWPWPADSQIFTTATYEVDRTDCTAHKAIAFDDCMDEDKVLRPYVDMFCRLAEPDPATCP